MLPLAISNAKITAIIIMRLKCTEVIKASRHNKFRATEYQKHSLHLASIISRRQTTCSEQRPQILCLFFTTCAVFMRVD
ncbi:hypothetical protein LIPSTDRAFT_68518 [Lipomyces starkeyi NRRL Y-11557]|uniref:Uncharacterized protein n=1 Tax=Lipomyces starkeyi NRRL Y-11557 TaxID=675824 RepID=A0A1E3QDS2_LIPST|nr:hypothetical protein LIPSTDRAFT_68518 [Lipomyces starkeyi NRRL Y-11557]